MKNNPYKEYLQELLFIPVVNFINSFYDFKKFIRTFWNILKTPEYIFKDYDTEKIYSPIEFSKRTLRLTLWVITIFIFIELYGKESNFIGLLREYLVILIYIISLMLMITLSYIFNYFGNLKLDNSRVIANAFINYFNTLFLFLISISLSRLELSDIIAHFILIPLLFGIYYFFRIGRELDYKIWKILVFSISASFIIIFLLMLNLILLAGN